RSSDLLIYLIIFTFSTILRPRPRGLSEEDELHPLLRAIGDAVVILGALHKGHRELREIQKEGLVKHFSGLGSMFLENFLSFLFCVSIYISMILRFVESPLEDLTLAFAAVSGWSYTLFFVLGFKVRSH